ncbi:15404_t:CDS:2, partial [Acaulospora morrowiae]
EAAASYCMKVLDKHHLNSVGTSFLICDCGGDTVNMMTYEILNGNKLGVITERIGDFCGGTYVDREFIRYISRSVDSTVINLREKHYPQYEILVYEFCRHVKIPFTGNRDDFDLFCFDLETWPAIKQYVDQRTKMDLESNDWLLYLNFETVKQMFDPAVDRIIRLIDQQLNSNVHDLSAIFLVGGFSSSEYLHLRVKEEFSSKVRLIDVPQRPSTVIVRGAVEYGLKIGTIKTR